MQPDQHPPESGRISFHYGLIFGLGLFVIAAILASISVFAFTGSNIGLLFSLLYWLIGLVAFFLGGMFAAKKTGKAATGTVAGLWAGIFNGVLYAIFILILFFAYTSKLPINDLGDDSKAEMTRQVLVALEVIGQVFALLISIGLGAGFGALGGLVGRATSNIPKQPNFGQPYPGQPYPGQPYPGQPYPGQPYPGQPYPGQPYPGQPYPGQPYPGQSNPEQAYSGQQYREQLYSAPAQPENSPVPQVGPSDAPAQDSVKRSERPSNIYNSYLEARNHIPHPQLIPPGRPIKPSIPRSRASDRREQLL